MMAAMTPMGPILRDGRCRLLFLRGVPLLGKIKIHTILPHVQIVFFAVE